MHVKYHVLKLSVSQTVSDSEQLQSLIMSRTDVFDFNIKSISAT